MDIPATKNFELKKHRFFQGRFVEQPFGRGRHGGFFGVRGRILQKDCKFIKP